MTSVSAGHIILTPTQPVGSGHPERESNPRPPDQESLAPNSNSSDKSTVVSNLPSFRLDPTVRHTVWNLVIGGCYGTLSLYGINQVQVHRCIACRTLKGAKTWVLLLQSREWSIDMSRSFFLSCFCFVFVLCDSRQTVIKSIKEIHLSVIHCKKHRVQTCVGSSFCGTSTNNKRFSTQQCISNHY